MQNDRRRDPYPWTWEIPVIAGFLVVLLLAVGVHLGRGLANLLVAGQWVWPTGSGVGGGRRSYVGGGFWSSLRDVVTGDSAAGLHPVPQGDLAGPGATVAGVVAVEVVVIAASTALVVHLVGRWGPQRLRGMATHDETQRILGRRRLKRVAAVVRPDLHRPNRRGGNAARVTRRRAADHGRQAHLVVAPAAGPDVGGPTLPYAPGAGAAASGGGGRGGTSWMGRWRSRRSAGFISEDVGWPLGRATEPRGPDLWVPWDRTTGVIGPQGSGKTLDLLVPALLAAPGAALVTLTKTEDLLLSLSTRASGGRPCVVLDPFGLAQGTPAELLAEMVWDPVAGCVDAWTAERRAKAFTAGTVSGAVRGGTGDDAARFYAAEAAKVLQCYLHAAALTGRSVQDVLAWVANPRAAAEPEEILRAHPHAEPFWHGLLRGALHGDDRTSANTVTTVQQTLGLFFQADTRRRCVPGPDRPATDIREVIRAGGTIYLLGREDPYASASPLMTAAAEHVLDTALALAHDSPWAGRLCPPFLACLDELPSTAPLPTLRTRMANERALGLSFIYAAQTRAQLTTLFGDHEARALLGLTNVLAVFGGSKDVQFNQEVSELLGTTRVARRTRTTATRGHTTSAEDISVLRPEEIRRLPERSALVIAETARPIIASLRRCLDGRGGQRLIKDQRYLRDQLSEHRRQDRSPATRAAAAVEAARRLDIARPDGR